MEIVAQLIRPTAFLGGVGSANRMLPVAEVATEAWRHRAPTAARNKGFGRISLRNGDTEIQAILFDFMGVLLFLRDDYPGEKTVDAVDDMIGGVVDDDAFRNAAEEKLSLSGEEFQKVLARIPEKYEPYPPLWDLLPSLRKQYKLGILNNGTRLTYPYFDAELGKADPSTGRPSDPAGA